ncbi:MAG: ComF family protein [Polyangiaceae bacterium]|nr:ComF family protein [Polyangiaceae bacterium]
MLPALARGFLEGVVAAASDFLAPPRCAACLAETGRRAVLCPGCAQTTERNPSPFTMLQGERVFAPYLYGGALRQAVVRFKYGGAPHLGRPLGDLLAGALATALADDPLWRIDGPIEVVPVPIHPRRLVQRGYNSPALLGSRVAEALGGTLVTDWLSRPLDAAPQAGKGRAARLRDVQHAFVAAPPRVVATRVVLVDDVVTTGATLHACAGALRRGGARVVRPVALCCALAENFPPGPQDGV